MKSMKMSTSTPAAASASSLFAEEQPPRTTQIELANLTDNAQPLGSSSSPDDLDDFAPLPSLHAHHDSSLKSKFNAWLFPPSTPPSTQLNVSTKILLFLLPSSTMIFNSPLPPPLSKRYELNTHGKL